MGHADKALNGAVIRAAGARQIFGGQAGTGLSQLRGIAEALCNKVLEHPFQDDMQDHRISLEPIGIAALITPWNWPINQICLKVGAALAAGCTMVLKPSEGAPMSAILLAEFLAECERPAGVFNPVHGDGAGAGTALVIPTSKNIDPCGLCVKRFAFDLNQPVGRTRLFYKRCLVCLVDAVSQIKRKTL